MLAFADRMDVQSNKILSPLIVFMNEGKIAADGTPDQMLDNPVNENYNDF